MDINGNGQLIEKNKIISVTQFDSPDNFERFRWYDILYFTLFIIHENKKKIKSYFVV